MQVQMLNITPLSTVGLLQLEQAGLLTQFHLHPQVFPASNLPVTSSEGHPPYSGATVPDLHRLPFSPATRWGQAPAPDLFLLHND